MTASASNPSRATHEYVAAAVASGCDVLHPLDGSHITIVRMVLKWPQRDPFSRFVTPELIAARAGCSASSLVCVELEKPAAMRCSSSETVEPISGAASWSV